MVYNRPYQKVLSFVATIALLLNSLTGVFLYPKNSLAQEVVSEESPSPTPSPEPTIEPFPEPSPSASLEIVETIVTEETFGDVQTSESSATLAVSLWRDNSDGSVTTINPVGEGVEYRYKDSQVKIVFTKLTTPGRLTIREFDPPQELGFVGKAYEITSDMQDGTFLYDLTLPVPSGAGENVEVKYVEDAESLEKAEAVGGSKEISDGFITIRGLNHFTIFVITDDAASYSGGLWFDYPNQGYLDTGVHFPTTVPAGQTATWAFSSITPGTYDVYISWSTHVNRTTAAPYVLNYNGGSANFTINQELLADQLTVGGSGQWSGWFYLDSYSLDASSTLVLNSVDNSSGQDYVIADEIRITQAPAIIYPANGAYKTTANQDKVDWTDSTGTYTPFSYKYESYYNSGYSALAYSSGWLSASEIPTPGTPAGTYYLRVKAKDSQGNETDWSNGPSNPYLVTVDNTAPSSSIFIQGDLDETKNIVGTSGWHGFGWYESYDNVNLSISSGNTALDFIKYQVLSGDQACPVAGDPSYTGSASHNENIASSVNSANGEKTLCFYAEDLSGNKESSVHKQILKVDNANPTFNINSVSGTNVGGVYYQNSSTISVEIGINDNLSGYTRTRFDLYNADASNNCTSYIGWNEDNLLPPSLSATRTLTKSGLADGKYCLNIWTYDDVQNKSGVQTVKFTIDTTAPSAPTIEFPNQEQYFNSSPILNDWSDVSDLSGIHHYRIEYQYDDGHTFSGAPYREATVSQRNHSPASFEQGGVKFRVQAFDRAGNEGAWSDWRHYYYDADTPSTPGQIGWTNENPPEGSDYDSGSDFDSYKTCGESLNYSPMTNIWGPSSDNLEGGVAGYERQVYSPINTLIYSSDRPVNYEHGGEAVDGATYWVRVRAYDFAGNFSDWTEKCAITYDATAPVSFFNSPEGGSIFGGPDETPISIEGYSTDEPSETVESTTLYYSPAGEEDWIELEIFENTDEEEPFDWGYAWIPEEDGEYDFKAVATDKAGNTEESAYLYGIIYDTTAPSLSWNNPTDGSTLVGVIPLNIDFSDSLAGVEEEPLVFYTPEGEGAETPIVGDFWDTSDPLPLGYYDLIARVSDRAGNSSESIIGVGVAALVSDEVSTTPTQTSAVITWSTDRPTTSRVIYDTIPHPSLGFDPNYGYAFSTPTFDTSPKVTNHLVTITGLSDGTVYFYRTISEGSPINFGSERAFKTLTYAGPPAPSGGSVAGTSTASLLGAANLYKLAKEPAQEEGTDEEVLGEEASPTPAGEEVDGDEGTKFLSTPTGKIVIVLSILGLLILLLLFRRRGRAPKE